MRLILRIPFLFLAGVTLADAIDSDIVNENSLGGLQCSAEAGGGQTGCLPLEDQSLLQVHRDQPSAPPTVWKRVWVPVRPSAKVLGRKGQLHSQVGQDWLVASLLGCKRRGFFVDLAANAANTLSNSLMLERDLDWQGVCVEPNPVYMEGLVERRCRYVKAVVGSPAGTEVDFNFDKRVLSGIIGKQFDNKAGHGRKMWTVSLEELLKSSGAPREIDYMSLDVEGAESMVMKDFPWDSYHFLVLTIERPKRDLVAALEAHGYRFLRRNSGFDDQTWVHESLPNLARVLVEFKNGATAEPSTCMTSLGHSWPRELRK